MPACESEIDVPKLVEKMRERPDVMKHDSSDFETKSEKAIQWLLGQCEGCPLCALSVLRQGRIFAFEVFDYRRLAEDYNKEIRQLSYMG